MNSVNPLIVKKEPVQLAATNRNVTTPDTAFQNMLSSEIDSRVMPADTRSDNATLPKTGMPKLGKVSSPSQEDKDDHDAASLSKPEDTPDTALIDTSSIVATLLSLVAAQTGQTESKQDATHAKAEGVSGKALDDLPPPHLLGQSVTPATLAGGGESSLISEGTPTFEASLLAFGQYILKDAVSTAQPALQRSSPEIPVVPTSTLNNDHGESAVLKHAKPSATMSADPGMSPDSALFQDSPMVLGRDAASVNDMATSVAFSDGYGAAHPDVGSGLAKQATPGVEPFGVAQMLPASHSYRVGSQMDVSDSLPPRVGSPDWSHALGQKVVWMVEGTHQTATLTLNPPDLGPMRIVLNVNDNQVGATFISAQPEVRAAIEAAMPRLHEMMESLGLQMSGSNIGSGASHPDRGGGGQGYRQEGRDGRGANQLEPVVGTLASGATISVGQGIIDAHV